MNFSEEEIGDKWVAALRHTRETEEGRKQGVVMRLSGSSKNYKAFVK